ncbi:MAG: CHASE2 domain-containing protein, partial [Bacteroidales bacterium]|nr:CHASE2 domain-containing protein [Bacteroidales bacterium]
MSLHLFRGIVREWVLVTLILLPLTAGLSLGSLVALDSLIYDRLVAQLRVPVDPRILLVEIDDRSVEALGRWPWPRDTHAQLLERLSGEQQPAGVLLDVIFTEPSADPVADERLGEAICKAGNVMLPLLRQSVIRPGEAPGEILPVAPLAHCAQRVGHINVEVDFDGVMRGIYLREGPPGEPRPQLSWLLYQQLMADAGHQATLPGRAGAEGGADEHWQRDHAIRIPFASGYPSVSYLSVLHGEVPASLLQGRVVLIGATAAGLGDRYVTPVSRHLGLTSGVVVQADILNSLLGQHSIVPLSATMAAMLATLPVVLLLLSLLLTRLRYAAPLTILMAVFTLALCWVLLRFGWWWPPAASLLGLLLASLMWSWRRLSAVLAYFGWELARLEAEPKVLPEHRAPLPSGPGDRLQRRVMA